MFLPIELIKKIYEYDFTFRNKYNFVIKDINYFGKILSGFDYEKGYFVLEYHICLDILRKT